MKLPPCLSSLDALIVENPVDLFYLTKMALSKGCLVLKKSSMALFVDGRYIEAAKKMAPCPVFPSEKEALFDHLQGKVGFDSHFTTVDSYQKMLKLAPHVEWVPCSNPIKDLRVYKNENEIRALKRAALLTFQGYQHIKNLLRVGVSEEELAFEFEFFCRKNGASGLSFEPIVAFGENSAYPHHRAGKTVLQENQIVLIDVGAIVDGYRGDMTRVDFFGEVDQELKRLFSLVKEAQNRAIGVAKPGVKLGYLDEIVRDFFEKEGVEKLFTHNLGHGIGLETHEYPRVRANSEEGELILRPSMVFTIEPGLYRPGLGGVRYEDTVIVTETGCERLC